MINEELLNDITVIVTTFEGNGDTMNNDDLNDLRRMLSVKLYYLKDVIKYIKKEWLTAEYQRKLAVAKEETRLINEKDENGKKLSQYDRKNKAIIACEEQYERENEAQANYDKIRIAIKGMEQVLNSIASYKS